MSSGIPHFEEFLTDLLNSFIQDPRIIAFIKEKLGGILRSLKTKVIQAADHYVTEQLIPELSRRIQSFAGVPVKPQLMLLRPFITRGLEILLGQGRILDKNEIIQMAKTTFPELVITTVMPDASEQTKTLVRNALNLVQEAVFAPRPGTTPSLETLLKTFYEKCADKIFCIAKEKLGQVIDKLIELMPDTVDDIMEFLIKHVLPAMSCCFEAGAFPLVLVFLYESSENLRKGGRIRGSDLAKPLATKALKIVVAKVTQNAGSKTVTAASEVTAKQSAKVTSKKVVKSVSDEAIKSLGGEATQQGVRVAGRKTIQKASAKVTKNIGEGISNGVTEVTKKAAVKKTTKAFVTETAETITTTTTKVTKESVSMTTQISQTSSKAAAEVGMKNAAKAGVAAAGISAVVGGVFLYRDLEDLDKQKANGSVSPTEYKKQKAQRIGEYAGDVIGSGIVGVAVGVAALTGPAGWAAIGAGALFSFATGKVGGKIGKALA